MLTIPLQVFQCVPRHKWFRKRCLIFLIAMAFSVLYIIVQNDLLLKSAHELRGSMEIRTQNELAFKLDVEASQVSKREQNRKRIGMRPVIYMFTTRLQTPIIDGDKCEIVRDPLRFRDSDAVIFHAKDLPLSIGMANLRSKSPFIDQIWVYFNLNSPVQTRNSRVSEMLFNFTITPKRNSDLHHPYGYYFNRSKTEKTANGGKIGFIAWHVNICQVDFRNSYVRLIQRYTSVDIYGSCGAQFGKQSTCHRGSVKCEELLATYKFYLAFEDSLCQDYNTGEYWGALHRGNLPIIMAGSNDTLIPNSYINVMDFETVKDLVNFLRYLDRNRSAYKRYFDWKKEYTLDFSPRDSIRNDIWLAQFCDILMKRDQSQRKFVNISEFYSVGNNCPEDNTNKILKIVRKGI